MEFKEFDYAPFGAEAQRTIANLEQAYGAWRNTERQLNELPNSMFWASSI